jgi:hypothetical protein
MSANPPTSASSHPLLAQLRDAGLTEIPNFALDLLAELSEEGPGLHTSAILEASPDDLFGWASLLIDRDDDAALCGFFGYGVQSHFFVLYWRQGPIIFLLRVAFGALEEAGASARRASGGVGLANALVERAASIDRAGLWPADRLMLVVSDAIGESGWCWMEAGRPDAAIALETSLDIVGAFAALDALDPSGAEDASDADEEERTEFPGISGDSDDPDEPGGARG